MNIRKMAVIILIFCFAFAVSSCGNVAGTVKDDPNNAVSGEPGNNEDENAANGQAKDEEGQTNESSGESAESGEEVRSKNTLNQISDFSDAWNDRYKMNEKAINDSELLIMELVTPGLEFTSGVQYDLLNMDNADGMFEGVLMLAGYPGFVEKSGSIMTFGYDYTREEDGFGPTAKAGDRIIETGDCDLKQGIYRTEKYTEREGKIITRTYSEFKLLDSGEMICLMTSGQTMDLKGDERISNTGIYIKAGKDQFDFVIGKAAEGPTFEKMEFTDKNDLTKDEARSLMESAGYTIDTTGGISGDLLVKD